MFNDTVCDVKLCFDVCYKSRKRTHQIHLFFLLVCLNSIEIKDLTIFFCLKKNSILIDDEMLWIAF